MCMKQDQETCPKTAYKSTNMSHGCCAVQILDGGKLKLSRKAVQRNNGEKEEEVEMPEEGNIYRWSIPFEPAPDGAHLCLQY